MIKRRKPHRPVSDTDTLPDDSARRLVDIMSDGFYMLLLIRNGQEPTAGEPFADAVRKFLADLELAGSQEDISNEDIHAAKYAFCAMVDETILISQCSFRDEWQRMPLQLSQFGDHLAGRSFFTRLENLRAQGAPRLQSLEVYYLCLLLGFEGKYRLEGHEELHYLTARLGDEIIYLKGRRTAFAPHWAPPDSVTHALRRTVPMWAAALVAITVGLAGYTSLHWSLSKYTHNKLSGYHDIVKMPTNVAHITIELP